MVLQLLTLNPALDPPISVVGLVEVGYWLPDTFVRLELASLDRLPDQSVDPCLSHGCKPIQRVRHRSLATIAADRAG